MKSKEQEGGAPRSQHQMQMFCEVIDFCELHDLGFNGFPYIWCNRRYQNDNMKVRLDHIFADES